MWLVFGPSSGDHDLGVVAELCPLCRRIAACSLTARYEGFHVYFITLAGSYTGAVCTCSLCGGHFAGEIWQYSNPVPALEARDLPLEELISRTNPRLKQRIEHARWLAEHETDPQFTKALELIEQLRYGDLRKGLMEELTRWDQLDDIRRGALLNRAAKLTQSLRFANTIAGKMPQASGCLVGLLVCLLVWSSLLFLPAARTLLWGGATIFAGLCAASCVWQILLARHVRRWTTEVLIPTGNEAGVDFQSFLDLLAGLPPPSPHNQDALRHLGAHMAEIRKALIAARAVSED